MRTNSATDRLLSGVLTTPAILCLSLVLCACSTVTRGGGDDPDMAVGDVGDGSMGKPKYNADAFFEKDPPPMYCGVDGGSAMIPGGTPDCPDDKNREGCPCTEKGKKTVCWPGLRANRGLGFCRDGETE